MKALISVSDKTGIVAFAKELEKLGKESWLLKFLSLQVSLNV